MAKKQWYLEYWNLQGKLAKDPDYRQFSDSERAEVWKYILDKKDFPVKMFSADVREWRSAMRELDRRAKIDSSVGPVGVPPAGIPSVEGAELTRGGRLTREGLEMISRPYQPDIAKVSGDQTEVVKAVQRAELLGKYEHPLVRRENVPGGLEKFVEHVKSQWRRGDIGSAIDMMYFDVAIGRKKREEADEFARKYDELARVDEMKARNWLERAFDSFIAMIPPMVAGEVAGHTAAIAGAVSAAAVPGGAKIVYPILHKMGAAQYWYRLGVGNTYRTLVEEGIEHNIAAPASLIAGIPYAAIEYSQVEKLIPDFSKRIVGRATANVVKKLMMAYGKNWLAEVTEEGLQEAVQQTALEVARGIRDKNPDVARSFLNVVGAMWNGVKGSAIPMLFMIGTSAAIQGGFDLAADTAEAFKGTESAKQPEQQAAEPAKQPEQQVKEQTAVGQEAEGERKAETEQKAVAEQQPAAEQKPVAKPEPPKVSGAKLYASIMPFNDVNYVENIYLGPEGPFMINQIWGKNYRVDVTLEQAVSRLLRYDPQKAVELENDAKSGVKFEEEAAEPVGETAAEETAEARPEAEEKTEEKIEEVEKQPVEAEKAEQVGLEQGPESSVTGEQAVAVEPTARKEEIVIEDVIGDEGLPEKVKEKLAEEPKWVADGWTTVAPGLYARKHIVNGEEVTRYIFRSKVGMTSAMEASGYSKEKAVALSTVFDMFCDALADMTGIDKRSLYERLAIEKSNEIATFDANGKKYIMKGVSIMSPETAIIRFFAGADVETGVHEMAHVFRYYLAAIDKNIADKLNRAYNQAGNKWTIEAEEKFADDFISWVAGVKPAKNHRVASIFRRLGLWLVRANSAIKGRPSKNSEFFDKLFYKLTNEDPLAMILSVDSPEEAKELKKKMAKQFVSEYIVTVKDSITGEVAPVMVLPGKALYAEYLKDEIKQEFLERGWSEDEYNLFLETQSKAIEIMDKFGVSMDDLIAPGETPLKENMEYILSVEFAAVCIRFNTITKYIAYWQKKHGRAITEAEAFDIIGVLENAGILAPCRACYAFARLPLALKDFVPVIKMLGFDDDFVNDYWNWWKLKIIPVSEEKINEVLASPDVHEKAKERIRKKMRNKTKSARINTYWDLLIQIRPWSTGYGHMPEPYTEYNGQLRKMRNIKYFVLAKNRSGGLRFHSSTDANLASLLDYYQIFMDMNYVGLCGHAYTKEPMFVEMAAESNLNINCSLMPGGGQGYIIKDGKPELVFSELGFPLDKALEFRERYPNVGTTIFVINDMHMRLALKDDRVDLVIPYHTSGKGPNIQLLRFILGCSLCTEKNCDSCKHLERIKRVMTKYKKQDPAIDVTAFWTDYSVKGRKRIIRDEKGKVIRKEPIDLYQSPQIVDKKKYKEFFANRLKEVRYKKYVLKVSAEEVAVEGMTPEEWLEAYLKRCDEAGIKPPMYDILTKPEWADCRPYYYKFVFNHRAFINGRYVPQKVVEPKINLDVIAKYANDPKWQRHSDVKLDPKLIEEMERRLNALKERRLPYAVVRDENGQIIGVEELKKKAGDTQVLGHVQLLEKHHDEQIRKKIVFDKTPEKPTVAGMLKALETNIISAVVDDFYPVKRFVEEAKKVKGVDKLDNDPYVLFRLTRGWYGAAKAYLYDGRPGGKPSLREILSRIAPEDRKKFSVYLVAKRALELAERGIDAGIPIESADYIAMEYRRLHPEFEAAANELYEYQDSMVIELMKCGLLSADAAAAILASNQLYVPFRRDIEVVPSMLGEEVPGIENPLRTIKGSQLRIHDPVASIIRNTYVLWNIIYKQRALNALCDLAEEVGLDDYISREKSVPLDNIDPNDTEALVVDVLDTLELMYASDIEGFWVVRDGEKVFYRADRAIVSAIATTRLDRARGGVLLRLLGIPARILRLGATTLSPEFGLSNPTRDQITALLHTKYRYFPPYDFFRGLAAFLGKNEMYKEWLLHGGYGAVLVRSGEHPEYQEVLKFWDRSPDEISKDLDGIKERIANAAKKVLGVATLPLEILESVSEATEAATRLGEYIAAREAGASPAEAAFASREITLDFAKQGYIAREANKIIAFLSANINGLTRVYDEMVNNPKLFAARVASYLILPTIVLWAINKDDDDLAEVPEWIRQTYWVFKIGDEIIRIPKPQGLYAMFASIPEIFLDGLYKGGDKAVRRLMRDIRRAVEIDLIPTVARPLLEAASGYSFFRKQRIEPKALSKLLPEDRYGLYTSEVAKSLGRLVGVSPVVIDTVIGGYTAGLGRLVLWMIDKACGKDIPLTFGTTPVFRAYFVKEPIGSASYSVNRFWEDYERVEQAMHSLDVAKRNKKESRRREILGRYPEVRMYPVYKEAAIRIYECQKNIVEVLEMDLTAEEKLQRVREYGIIMTRTAAEVNRRADELRERYGWEY